MPGTPEKLIKRQRLNRKILLYLAGLAGLVLTLMAIGWAVWFTAIALAVWWPWRSACPPLDRAHGLAV